MNTRRIYAMVIGLSVFALSACNSSDAPAAATPPSPAVTPQQQIMANFKPVRDDETWLHHSAWKDASGVIWSQAVLSATGELSLASLESGCNRLGGTLPTSEELNQLAEYLGRGSDLGFHPEYLQDPVPGTGMSSSWDLRGMLLASSTLTIDSMSIAGIDGDNGDNVDISLSDTPPQDSVGALCIFPKQKAQVNCQIQTTTNCTEFYNGRGPIEFNKNIANDGSVIGAAVMVSNVDASGRVKLTLQMNDLRANRTVTQSYFIDARETAQKSIDITASTNGAQYELACAVAGVEVQSLVGESCQLIH